MRWGPPAAVQSVRGRMVGGQGRRNGWSIRRRRRHRPSASAWRIGWVIVAAPMVSFPLPRAAHGLLDKKRPRETARVAKPANQKRKEGRSCSSCARRRGEGTFAVRERRCACGLERGGHARRDRPLITALVGRAVYYPVAGPLGGAPRESDWAARLCHGGAGFDKH